MQVICLLWDNNSSRHRLQPSRQVVHLLHRQHRLQIHGHVNAALLILPSSVQTAVSQSRQHSRDGLVHAVLSILVSSVRNVANQNRQAHHYTAVTNVVGHLKILTIHQNSVLNAEMYLTRMMSSKLSDFYSCGEFSPAAIFKS